MTIRQITYDDTIEHVSWPDAVAALREGHRLPPAQVADMFLGPGNATLLSRGAWIEGLGSGVKSVTVFDDNPRQGLPTIQGGMLVFEPKNGCLEAVIEGRLVTEIKTAADSVLGATYLARPDSRHLLIVGGGTVARSLIKAYTAVFPSLKRVSIWTRRQEQARAVAAEWPSGAFTVKAAPDLAEAAGQADIISCATMAREPVLRGAWIHPGTHVDLIGAYKADMREADDDLISRASLYVDSRETTIHHIGELMMPIASGAISEASVIGDLYDLAMDGASARRSPDEITVYKNGGGAHLDLMTARYISSLVSNT
ncbi:ornithine cyclodeaminase [uncultured Sulfitobacter sp.]|jgi:ornithine cyclodeaminase|uniref:ornithine cyclodeaminase family protein n=1 Tax=uncultured Sulfitobacter sp. TaxID=191468 RepID=UPI00259A4F54|nr:ornithine cyclodeaminase [uncultured Sulfitobacter sp.]